LYICNISVIALVTPGYITILSFYLMIYSHLRSVHTSHIRW